LDIAIARKNLHKIEPLILKDAIFVRAYNTLKKTKFGRDYLFESEWSFKRGYRYNFRETYPVLYLAGDHITASAEIGARTYKELLLPHLKMPEPPFIYFSVRVTANVLDLTNSVTRKQLGVDLAEILISTDDWDKNMEKGIWSVTHEIGKLAVEDLRFDGILYPSYPSTFVINPGDKHKLAIFMDSASIAMAKPRGSGVKLEVVDNYDFLKNLELIF
jgi:RES domain-containing protein